MLLKLCTVVFILTIASLNLIECGKPLMCYVAAYSVYRPEPAKFTPDLIDPFLCTHLIYAHLGIASGSGIVTFTDAYADLPSGLGLVDKVAAIKKKNPSLKVLFSLGGWNVGSINFSKVAESEEMRKQLAKNIIASIKAHNYDGIDMNWMYPDHRGGKPEDVANYILLLKEVRKEIKKHGYLLVALMSGNEYVYRKAYELKKMADLLDYVLLLSYDYHGFWDGKTGVFAPLRYTDSLSVTSTVEAYLRKGIQSEKILLGFATSSRTFTADSNFRQNQFFGVPASRSFTTSWTKEEGFMGYNEICHEFKHNDLWTPYWDSGSSTPFAVNGRKLISYENNSSFEIKLNYLKEKNLGGAMVWSLDTDDFTGDCFNEKYPLTSIIKRALQDESDLLYPIDVRTMAPPAKFTEEIIDETEDVSIEFKTPKIISAEIINILFT